MADMRNLLMFKQHRTPGGAADGAGIDSARVVQRDKGEFLLMTPAGQVLRAKKAAGCLLEPEGNDTVLIVRNLAAGVYILTVLERGGGEGRVVLPATTTLGAADGTLRIAGDRIELAGTTSTSIEAPEIKVQGTRGEVSFAALSLTACVAAVKTGRLSLVASTVDTVAQRITQRVKDCFRQVARMDSTRAAQVHIRAENRLDLQGGDTSLLARQGVKIDGDKIHLG